MNTLMLAYPTWILLSLLALTLAFLANKQSKIEADTKEMSLAPKYAGLGIVPLLAIGIAIVFFNQGTPEMPDSCDCHVLRNGLAESFHRVWFFLS